MSSFITSILLLACILYCSGQGNNPLLPAPTTTTTTTTTRAPPKPESRTGKPDNSLWPGEYNKADRNVLGDWLIYGCHGNNCKDPSFRETEVEGYDGWYNNLANPQSGAIDGELLRRWPAAYKDGTYQPSGWDRPNPIDLSDSLLSGDIGSQSRTGRNALLVFFGQQVVEEILDAQRPGCPPEYFNIPIPENHTYRQKPGHTILPFLRSRFNQRTGYSPNNPRQQLNEITPYLDGNLMYGITKQWSDQLRKYKNGTVDPDGLLAHSHDGLFPEYNDERMPLANPPPPFYHSQFIKQHEIAKVSRFFKLGNPRGNENAFLLSFGILWFRWHNYVARTIRRHNPDRKEWPSERVFNEARKWVIATQQHIIIDEWLPAWTNISKFPSYTKYDPSIDPQIDQFFQSAAFRFGHTLVVPAIYIRDYGRNGCSTNFKDTWGKEAIRTCNIFWRPQEPIANKTKNNDFIDIDRLLMGMSLQLCEEEDHKIVEDLRGNVFGPLEFPRRDLMAVNIQRGRDHGLPDFNSARRAFGLKPIDDYKYFEQYVKDEDNTRIMGHLKRFYSGENISKIDPWVGGIMETVDGPGELFETVIHDQFRRIRDGDRFWYENKENGLFTVEEVARLKELSLYDIIMAVTKMDHDDIPTNPFRVPSDLTKISHSCRGNLTRSNCYNTTIVNEKRINSTTFPCFHLPQLNVERINESCTQEGSYDYFYNSELSYILSFSFLAAFMLGIFGVAFILIKHQEKINAKESLKVDSNVRNTYVGTENIITATEWVSKKSGTRPVVISFKDELKQIKVLTQRGQVLRIIDLSHDSCALQIYDIGDQPYIIMKAPNAYDLVLNFDSDYLKKMFQGSLDKFLKITRIKSENISNINIKSAMKTIVTREDRQKKLEMFFRVVFAQAFKIDHSKKEMLSVDMSVANEIRNMELTLYEFAEALDMPAQSEFVTRMFYLIDKDRNGSVSFQEFADLLVVFANGTEEEKARLLFDMYDINALQYLTVADFTAMIRSFLETVGGKIESTDLEKTIENMIQTAGLQNKSKFYFEDFKRLVGNDISKLSKATLGFKGVADNSFLANARDTIENIYESPADIQARIHGINTTDNIPKEVFEESLQKEKPSKVVAAIRYIEGCYLEIFWLTLYTLVLWAIFAERAYYYTIEREHSGLRRIAGYGVTVTRGAASAMMFTYSSLLVTMCRNIITYFRGTMLNKYFPFDSYVEIHKYIAYWALFFTIMHIIGHSFNFYHITTQTADDLTCLFRNYFHATHEIPKFHYWCWQTMTGITGIILTIITAIIYIFAQKIVRRKIFNWFWYTHALYPLFFIFMILHGAGRLIQEPFFYYFFLGPVILFTINVLISASRKKIELPVLNAIILPSDVTMLEFKRPENFQYISGQFVRIACLGLSGHEYHPFTLTSSPDEENLTVHIRAVGPWTRHIRKVYDDTLLSAKQLPKVYLDGPYGEGHQDWFKYDVSVLVGGGIGVTPFASILKDIVFQANSKYRAKCKKVYFIWVTKTQKHFEWLVDIIRNMESTDKHRVVTSHIFITQFYEKFDLRTILLYICERHYQRICNRSLFTNLEAVTHFSRPNFPQFFHHLQAIHKSNARSIGVFSCGPPTLTKSVETACLKLNQQTSDGPTFEHHFENF